MGRPNKNTVEYFPHYVKPGKTIHILEQKYGNDGYAFWFKLLEILCHTDNHFYDCNNPLNWEFLLSITHLSDVSVNSILDTLSKLEKIDSELWENRIIWCQNLVNNLDTIYKRRSTETPVKPTFCIQKNNSDIVSVDINSPESEFSYTETDSRVKESIVKKSRVENTEQKKFSHPKISKTVFSETEKCPHKKIIELFKSILPDLRISDGGEWGPLEQGLLRETWSSDEKYQSLEFWQNLFERIRDSSPFLLGKKKKFKATLCWIVTPDNFKKVIKNDSIYFEENHKEEKSNQYKLSIPEAKEKHKKEIEAYDQKLIYDSKCSDDKRSRLIHKFINELRKK